MIEDNFKLYHRFAVAIFERAILDYQKPVKKKIKKLINNS